MQALYPGRNTLEELARWSPKAITAWRLRRLCKASYGCVHMRIEWLAIDVINTLPPPEDGILFEIDDGSHVPKRGTQNPTAPKGRKSQYPAWFFGIRFGLLIVAWEVYRIPVAFRIILPQTHPDYRPENAQFREMLSPFKPPSWAKSVVVLGDAGYGSKANIKLIKPLDKADRGRSWHVVFAMSRTWKTVDDKAVKDLGT